MTKHEYNYTGSTANRGVEAKELEIANTQLDRNTITSSTSSARADYSAHAAHTPRPSVDDTDSYVQVVVQKHRRARAPPATSAAQTSPRLPAASSPIGQLEGAGAGDGVLLLPASVLLACPPAHQVFHHQNIPIYKTLGEYGKRSGDEGAAGLGGMEAPAGPGGVAGCARSPACDEKHLGVDAMHSLYSDQKIHKKATWKILNSIAAEKKDLSDNVPERVEVYYFEHGSASYLATRTGGRVTRVERAGRRAARTASALLAEPLAAAQLLFAAPVTLLVNIERCVLMTVRDLVTGSVQTVADYAVKPALTLVFNAAVAPSLACAANVARAARDAARPLWLALADAVEPAARLLGQLSVVQVRLDSRRDCQCSYQREIV